MNAHDAKPQSETISDTKKGDNNMQSLINAGFTTILLAAYFCVGVWVLENTKLGDKVDKLLEKVFM